MKMENKIELIVNDRARSTGKKVSIDEFGTDAIRKVRPFHKSFPQYEETPLRELNALSNALGVKGLLIKDESFRFGLNAFKVLGGSYAVGMYLARKLGTDISDITFEKLKSDKMREEIGNLTFVTATDGNHGRGVAWAAKQLGQKSVVFMPKGSMETRLMNIRREGAEAYITDHNYDDTVRIAKQYAKEHNGVLIQDSVKEDYKEIPTWIMQGYTTLIDEALEQIRNNGKDMPTHVFLQAGVGAFAGAVVAYLASGSGEKRPLTVIVEPDEAACFYLSMAKGDGKPHVVDGFMPTIMAGLACGEPCSLSWEILKDYADYFISCTDDITVEGMRVLAHPMGNDHKVVSGESGAVGIGLVKTILEQEEYKDVRRKLKIDKESEILFINTEGDTDPVNYRRLTV